MIGCGFCPRKFSKRGFQEQMSQLKVHVLHRHPHEAALKHPNDWYKEEDVDEGIAAPDAAPSAAPPRDAGDAATKLKWQFAAAGVVVIVLDQQGAHVGASGLSPAQMREVACAAIHASYEQQKQAARTPLIGKV